MALCCILIFVLPAGVGHRLAVGFLLLTVCMRKHGCGHDGAIMCFGCYSAAGTGS